MPKQTLEELLLNLNEENKQAEEEEEVFTQEQIEKIARSLGEDVAGGDPKNNIKGGTMTKEAQIKALAKELRNEYTDESIVKLANEILAGQHKPEEYDGVVKTANFEFTDELMEKVALATLEGRAQAIEDLLNGDLEKTAGAKDSIKKMVDWLVKKLHAQRYTQAVKDIYGLSRTTPTGKFKSALKGVFGGMKAEPGSAARLIGIPLGVAGAGYGGYLGYKKLRSKKAEIEDPEAEWLGKVAAWGYISQILEAAKEAGVDVPVNAPQDEDSQAAVEAADAALQGMSEVGVDPTEAAATLVDTVKENPEEAAKAIVQAQDPEEAAKVVAQAAIESAQS